MRSKADLGKNPKWWIQDPHTHFQTAQDYNPSTQQADSGCHKLEATLIYTLGWVLGQQGQQCDPIRNKHSFLFFLPYSLSNPLFLTTEMYSQVSFDFYFDTVLWRHLGWLWTFSSDSASEVAGITSLLHGAQQIFTFLLLASLFRGSWLMGSQSIWDYLRNISFTYHTPCRKIHQELFLTFGFLLPRICYYIGYVTLHILSILQFSFFISIKRQVLYERRIYF